MLAKKVVYFEKLLRFCCQYELLGINEFAVETSFSFAPDDAFRKTTGKGDIAEVGAESARPTNGRR